MTSPHADTTEGLAGRVETDRWSIELPEGWTAGQTGGQLQLVPLVGVAHMFVTDLKVELSKASAFVAVEGVRSLLTTAKATTDRVDEEPFGTEDGRQVALASGVSDLGYCAAAAHVWPGTILLLSLFQGDGDVKVRRDARSIFLSVRRREAAGPGKSRLTRLLRR